jgi:hypothetical protein
MRTIFITILLFAITITAITKIAYPDLMDNGKKVKDRTQQYYDKSLTNT